MKDKIESKLKQGWNWLKMKLSQAQKPPLDYASRKNVALPNWPLIKSVLARWRLPIVLALCLCLMMLFGCTTKRIAVQPPAHLVAPISLPPSLVEGNAPDACVAFTLDMLDIYAQCESQKRETIKHYRNLQ